MMAVRDDGLLPETRVAGWFVTVALAVGAVVLYFYPADTARLWAWPVQPEMTAMTLGAGYLAGAAFFVRALLLGRWHAMALALIAATVLSALMLVATIVHWDRFTHDAWQFWAWLVIYVVTPVMLPVLWWRNRRRDPGHVGDVAVPMVVRRLFGVAGLLVVGAGLAMFVRPDLAADRWPWEVTSLTVRTMAAFGAFVGTAWLTFAFEPRWSAHRLHVDAVALGLVLVAAAALRATADFQRSGVASTVFAGLLAGAIVALLSLRVAMALRSSGTHPAGAPVRSAGRRGQRGAARR